MQSYKRDFIRFALEQGVLGFGEFVLKSGRTSPYFFNSGLFSSGRSLARLARFYAAAIRDSGLEFDMLYGPAYKGIPLVAAVAVAFAEIHDLDYPYCFNRKEAKDHGEGGATVGAPLAGRVLMIDDVISAGTSSRESIGIITGAGAEPVGVAIALDRQERGAGALSAIQELERDHGLAVVSIVSLADLMAYLDERGDLAQALARMRAYRETYGCA